MEKKYLYTFKDVILGLRPLYQTYFEDLKKLKELCESDANVENFSFYVHQGQGNIPKLYCDIVEKESILKSTLGKIKDALAGDDITQNTLCYETGRLIGIRRESPVTIHPDKELLFSEEANKILKSDFIASINEVKQSGIKSLCEGGTLYIRTNNIILNPAMNNPLPKLLYYPLEDTIILTETDSKFKVSKYGFDRLMEMYFFVDSFPDYHITSMNVEAMKQKKLFIDQLSPCHNIELTITENDDTIRLIKSKKDKC